MKRSNALSTDTGKKSHKKAKEGTNDKENTVVGNKTQNSSIIDVSPSPSIENHFRVPFQNVTNQRSRVARKEILDNRRTIGITTSNRGPHSETQRSPSTVILTGSGNGPHPAINSIGKIGNLEGSERSTNISARKRKTLGSPPSMNSKRIQTKGNNSYY
ncbi:unnamed protein product [Eruca vesicaria subsp. sativa]|uniref:Uncharacterized protein n=1 Tax=Eruca vesicaria subsp. sativa TaxID=29727 RepID=A0ABC8LKH4_ERUVS|nr:unnamed protein product [Eruca vesicaria subsp. sativa]